MIVSAVAFAACSLLSARLQGVVGRWRCAPQAAFLLGAVMIGGWTLSGTGLVGLAVAQGLSGLAQCTLEGDLDARAVARLGPRTTTAGLALASSSRALGGAVSVAALPVLVVHVPLPAASLAAAAFLLVACVLSTWQPRRVPVPPAQLAAALAG